MEVLKINSPPALKQDTGRQNTMKWSGNHKLSRIYLLLYALIIKNIYYNNTRRSILGSQEAVRCSHHPIVAMTHSGGDRKYLTAWTCVSSCLMAGFRRSTSPSAMASFPAAASTTATAAILPASTRRPETRRRDVRVTWPSPFSPPGWPR